MQNYCHGLQICKTLHIDFIHCFIHSLPCTLSPVRIYSLFYSPISLLTWTTNNNIMQTNGVYILSKSSYNQQKVVPSTNPVQSRPLLTKLIIIFRSFTNNFTPYSLLQSQSLLNHFLCTLITLKYVIGRFSFSTIYNM